MSRDIKYQCLTNVVVCSASWIEQARQRDWCDDTPASSNIKCHVQRILDGAGQERSRRNEWTPFSINKQGYCNVTEFFWSSECRLSWTARRETSQDEDDVHLCNKHDKPGIFGPLTSKKALFCPASVLDFLHVRSLSHKCSQYHRIPSIHGPGQQNLSLTTRRTAVSGSTCM